MDKKKLAAWILLGVGILVLLLTRGSTEVRLLVLDVKLSTSIALLAAAGFGVLVGSLLR
jgi:hypothetical protein